MAGPSRIDELRKKFDENPRRYFAPLANEYRKLGDFEQAIFICQEFLPQQPGHMSGHIVYGQALFEAGRHDESRTVFETALALDPENLIALRHLGDIARAKKDPETARAWYRRVLESDPRNEEISALIAAVEQEAAAPPPAPQAPPEVAIDPAVAGLAVDQTATTPVAAKTPVEQFEPPPSEPEHVSQVPGLMVSEFAPPLEEPAHPSLHDSADIEVETPIFEVPAELPADPSPLDGINVSRRDSGSLIDASRPGDFVEVDAHMVPAEPAAAPLPFLESLTPASAAEPIQAPAAPEPPPPPPPPPPAPAPRAPEPAVAEPSADAEEAFLTETMAELYLRQGHREQAVEVYRRLVTLRPKDAALRARLRELEEPPPVDLGPTIRDVLAALALRRPMTAPEPTARGSSGNGEREPPRTSSPVDSLAEFLLEPAPPAESDSASSARAEPPSAPPQRASGPSSMRSSQGRSLDSLFSGLAPQPEDDEAASALADAFIATGEDAPREPGTRDFGKLAGRPATPAASELSLDHVFGRPTGGTPTVPAFSFDQFFSQQAKQDANTPNAEPARDSESGAPDDIQQFNAWLEGLKKS